MFLVLTRSPRRVEHFSCSDGQVSVNLRKKIIEKNSKTFLYLTRILSIFFLKLSFVCLFLFFFFLSKWDPYVPLFHFLVRFSSETIYLVPVSILFILIEYY